jgi:uncharacterized membrane protein
MTEPTTAVDALQQRRRSLINQAAIAERQRDRNQLAANQFNEQMQRAFFEIASIDNALELLTAAVDFATAQPRKEEPDA